MSFSTGARSSRRADGRPRRRPRRARRRCGRAAAPRSATRSRRSVDVGRPLRDRRKRPSAFSILLLSDGANPSGITPLEGAAHARRAKAPVYTIALGTPHGRRPARRRLRHLRTIPVPPDPETLRQVAAETGGRFFDAPSEEDLSEVYDRLSSRVGFIEEQHDVSYAFAAGAAVLLLRGDAVGALVRPHPVTGETRFPRVAPSSCIRASRGVAPAGQARLRRSGRGDLSHSNRE